MLGHNADTHFCANKPLRLFQKVETTFVLERNQREMVHLSGSKKKNLKQKRESI